MRNSFSPAQTPKSVGGAASGRPPVDYSALYRKSSSSAWCRDTRSPWAEMRQKGMLCCRDRNKVRQPQITKPEDWKSGPGNWERSMLVTKATPG